MKENTKTIIFIIGLVILGGMNIYISAVNRKTSKENAELKIEIAEINSKFDAINLAKDKIIEKYRVKIKENKVKQDLNDKKIAELKKKLKKDEQAIIDYPTDFNSKFDILADNLSD